MKQDMILYVKQFNTPTHSSGPISTPSSNRSTSLARGAALYNKFT